MVGEPRELLVAPRRALLSGLAKHDHVEDGHRIGGERDDARDGVEQEQGDEDDERNDCDLNHLGQDELQVGLDARDAFERRGGGVARAHAVRELGTLVIEAFEQGAAKLSCALPCVAFHLRVLRAANELPRREAAEERGGGGERVLQGPAAPERDDGAG